MTKSIRVVSAALALALGSPAALLAAEGAAKGETAKAASGADIKSLYQKSCASCHGKDGKGNPALTKAFKLGAEALDLTDEGTLAKSDEELAKATHDGRGKMPGYKGKLDEAAIKEMTGYIRSLAPPKPK